MAIGARKSGIRRSQPPSASGSEEVQRADKGITEEVRHEALDLLDVYWPRHLRAKELIEGKAPDPKQ